MTITHLLYRSFSQHGLSKRQVDTILAKSQERNLEREISGLLLYRNNTFLQLLEGKHENVIECFGRIRRDKRHFDVNVVLIANGTSRLFPEWSMGYIPEEKIVRPFDALNDKITETLGEGLKPRAAMLKVLKSFIAPDYLEKYK